MSLEILPNGSDDRDQPLDERLITEVLQAIADGPVRATDVARLSDLDRAGARELTGRWPDLSEETRTAIVRLMDELAEERFELSFSRALRPALEDDSAVVRQLAIAALWEDTSLDLFDRLLALFATDPSADVRAEAAKALGRFADLAIQDELDETRGETLRVRLLDAATDPDLDPVIRRRALESVGAFGRDEEVREAMESGYGSEDQSMIASALFAMGRSHDPYWDELLLAELNSPEAELRFEAVRALGLLGSEDAVPELAALADDEDLEVRHAVFTALGQIGGKSAVRVLERFAAAAAEAEEEADSAIIAEALAEATEHDDLLGSGS